MALTRVEKAMSIPLVSGVPAYFQHSVTPNRPTEPTASLGAEDSQRYTLWKAARENGTLVGFEEKNVSPALQVAMTNFLMYLASAPYKAWAATDMASRETQWRLMLVDVAEAVNAKATVAISLDSTGAGSPAPTVTEITRLGIPPIQNVPLPVTNGDKKDPQLVFGDDGDIVTNI